MLEGVVGVNKVDQCGDRKVGSIKHEEALIVPGAKRSISSVAKRCEQGYSFVQTRGT